jgi:hypothetical protein
VITGELTAMTWQLGPLAVPRRELGAEEEIPEIVDVTTSAPSEVAIVHLG